LSDFNSLLAGLQKNKLTDAEPQPNQPQLQHQPQTAMLPNNHTDDSPSNKPTVPVKLFDVDDFRAPVKRK